MVGIKGARNPSPRNTHMWFLRPYKGAAGLQFLVAATHNIHPGVGQCANSTQNQNEDILFTFAGANSDVVMWSSLREEVKLHGQLLFYQIIFFCLRHITFCFS